LIDTVQNNSDPKGLLYSLYASVQDFNNGISKIDASRNPYLCNNSPGSAKYVLKESFSQDQEYQQYPMGTQEKYNSFQSSIIPMMKDGVKTGITERQGGGKGLESFRNPEDFEEAGFGRPWVPPAEEFPMKRSGIRKADSDDRGGLSKEYDKNPLYDPIVWFYFSSVVLILSLAIFRKYV
jgi:hypothetical protein